MNTDKIEKAIPICSKTTATIEEIIMGCGGTFKIYFDGEGGELEKGLMSVSYPPEGYCLAVCIWRIGKDGKYQKTTNFRIPQGGLITLSGFATRAVDLEPLDTVI